MREFIEPARSLPIFAEYDVVVVGGGIAGVAAAVAARRGGSRVCLIEKTCVLGGLATAGNVIVYLPICDGMGNQVIGGLSEELLKLSVRDVVRENKDMRVDMVPSCWLAGGSKEERSKARYRVQFNPVTYLLALEELVLNEGIALCYDMRLCGCMVSAGTVEGLIVENKDGRGVITGKSFVDASGDADLCHFAGEETTALETNVACGWYYYIDHGTVKLHCLSQPFPSDGGKARDGIDMFDGHTAAGVNAQLLASRRLLRAAVVDKAKAANDESLCPILVPTMPTHRMTRRLVGRYELSLSDMHRWHDDALGMTGDWRKAGPVYCLPMGVLAGRRVRNLLAAGRCISAVGSAWDMTRAIPTCSATGEAAGVVAGQIAAMSVPDLNAVDIRRVQDDLKKRGALIEPSLLVNGHIAQA